MQCRPSCSYSVDPYVTASVCECPYLSTLDSPENVSPVCSTFVHERPHLAQPVPATERPAPATECPAPATEHPAPSPEHPASTHKRQLLGTQRLQSPLLPPIRPSASSPSSVDPVDPSLAPIKCQLVQIMDLLKKAPPAPTLFRMTTCL